jgi:hypothetical protein
MDNECKECQKDCRTEIALHRHLRSHKLTQAAYYQKHYPRYDKYDNTIIRFKNREFYFNADFNSRANLGAWLNRLPQPEAKDYLRKLLSQRKEAKSLSYSLSQVELRSLVIPGMVYFNNLFGNYYVLCSELGFKNKFSKFAFAQKPKKFQKNHLIICDTREQLPLAFHQEQKQEGLNFGDYKLNDDLFTHNCCIERKAVGDFCGTLSAGFERFKKEVSRAQEAGFYLVVVIESPLNEIYEFAKKLSHKNIRISPEYIFHNMRELCQSFPMIQFLFVENRKHAVLSIERIFQSDGEYKQVDLQYLYDTGKLI